MKKVFAIFGLLSGNLLLQGCFGHSILENNKDNYNKNCNNHCERKYLLKQGYQRAKNIERCKKRCGQHEAKKL